MHVFGLFQGAFDNDDDFLVCVCLCVLFYYDAARLVTVDFHYVQYAFDLCFGEFREIEVFFKGPFEEIPESHRKYLIAEYLRQRLPAKHQTHDIILGLHRHLPNGIIEERLLAKGISLLQPLKLLIALPQRGRALLDNIERRPGIPLRHNDLILREPLRNQRSRDTILMLIRQTGKEPHILHKLPILLILQRNNLLNGPPKRIPVNPPQIASLAGLHRGRPRRLIEQRQLAEAVAHSQLFLHLFVGDDLHHALFDDEEAQGFAALFEDVLVGGHRAVEHLLRDVLELGLGQVVEDEVVL